MAYIGKEAEFHLIQFFFLSFLQLPLIHSQITGKGPIYGKGNQQAINEISQRSFPIRILYNDLYSCTATAPLLTVICRIYFQIIRTRRKIGIRGSSCPCGRNYFMPLLIQPLQPVAIVSLWFIDIIQCREIKRYKVLVIIQDNLLSCAYRLAQ